MRGAQDELRSISPRQHPELVSAIQAKLLALQGRGGDTEIAHVTPGEVVIPRNLQTPAVMRTLAAAAARAGIDPRRYTVGHRANSVNPRTGTGEFTDKTIEEIVVSDYFRGFPRGGLFGGSPGGAGLGSGDIATPNPNDPGMLNLICADKQVDPDYLKLQIAQDDMEIRGLENGILEQEVIVRNPNSSREEKINAEIQKRSLEVTLKLKNDQRNKRLQVFGACFPYLPLTS
ncbi:MAG: hypothetical protein SFV19_06655 [Rhodospirillaceae bacterium]|nr:hypothetical protein [Rhodospirillaceae bacterium]